MPRPPSPQERAALRDALKSRVRAAAIALIADGLIPTRDLLRGRVEGGHAAELLLLRDELLRQGLLPPWPPRGRNPGVTPPRPRRRRPEPGAIAEPEPVADVVHGHGLGLADSDEIDRRRAAVLLEKQAAWAMGHVTTTGSDEGCGRRDGRDPGEPRVHRYVGPRQRGRVRQ